jgi:tetratricopeptide (TPR) repeat protein
MSNNFSNNGLIGFIQRLGGSIVGVIAFLTSVMGFIKLLQGDAGLVTKVLLTLGIVGLWLTCAYIYWKPATKNRIPGFTPPTSSKQGKQIRRLALAGMIAIPILTSTGFYGWQHFQNRPTKDTIVLVADFEGPDPKNYRVAKNIYDRLNDATKKYSDVSIQRSNQVISESKVARSEGKKRKATIVIWGDYGVTDLAVQLSTHFEVLRLPKDIPELEQQTSGVVQTPDVAELKSFKLQTRLSAEMAYLSLFTLGTIRYTVSDWDGAITRLSNALSQAKQRTTVLDQSIVYFYRGNAYKNKGDYDRALADYNQVLKLKPYAVNAYNNRGIAYSNKSDYNRAIADYNQAIKLQPDTAYVYYNRGIAYNKKGEYERAIADYNQAIKLQPDYTNAYNNRGNIYNNKGEYERAIADYNQAIKLQPDYTNAYNNRGWSYAQKGDYNRAVADYNQTLELDSKNFAAYNNRGYAYAQNGDYERALVDINQALKLKPNHPAIIDSKGFAYAGKGDYNRALADYNQAIKIDSKADYAYHHRGVVYRKQGKTKQAIADFQKVLELTKDSERRQDTKKQLQELGVK